jgi:hypothetical protein
MNFRAVVCRFAMGGVAVLKGTPVRTFSFDRVQKFARSEATAPRVRQCRGICRTIRLGSSNRQTDLCVATSVQL